MRLIQRSIQIISFDRTIFYTFYECKTAIITFQNINNVDGPSDITPKRFIYFDSSKSEVISSQGALIFNITGMKYHE